MAGRGAKQRAPRPQRGERGDAGPRLVKMAELSRAGTR
jgi:hypothetical protein